MSDIWDQLARFRKVKTLADGSQRRGLEARCTPTERGVRLAGEHRGRSIRGASPRPLGTGPVHTQPLQ